MEEMYKAHIEIKEESEMTVEDINRLSNSDKLRWLRYKEKAEGSSSCRNCRNYNCPLGVSLCEYFGIQKGQVIELPGFGGTCRYMEDIND